MDNSIPHFSTIKMHVDYIVVGLGISGISLCNILERNDKTFVVYDSGSFSATEVASGLYNPVALKWLKPVWNGLQFAVTAHTFYTDLERSLGVSIHQQAPLYRKFNSPYEQNEWFRYGQKEVLKPFLGAELKENNNPHVSAPQGFGEVLHTGSVKTELLRRCYIEKLKRETKIRKAEFLYEDLECTKDAVLYRDIEAKYIVFCEGFGMNKNPYFNTLPLLGNKGEVLTIEAPELMSAVILHSSVFVVPFEGSTYKVGATYNATEKNTEITAAAREELSSNLEKMVSCPYKVINHQSGIRPVVSDKKPLLGRHPKYPRMAILNGMGSRGVLMAPFLSDMLYKHLEEKQPIAKEVDINRFTD